MSKEKVLYEEVYGTGQLSLRKDMLPELLHTRSGYKCTDACILRVGTVEKEGKEQAFQVIKFYLDIPEDWDLIPVINLILLRTYLLNKKFNLAIAQSA